MAISDSGGVHTPQGTLAALRRGSAPYAVGVGGAGVGAPLPLPVTSPTAALGRHFASAGVAPQPPLVTAAGQPSLHTDAGAFGTGAPAGDAAGAGAGAGAPVSLVSLPSYPTGSTTGSGLPASPSHSAVTSPSVRPNMYMPPLTQLMMSSTPYPFAGASASCTAIPTSLSCTIPAAYITGGNAGVISSGAISLQALALTVYRIQEEHNNMCERLLSLSRQYQQLLSDSITERETLLDLQRRRLHPIAESLERDSDQRSDETNVPQRSAAPSSVQVPSSAPTVTPQPQLGAGAATMSHDSTIDSDPNVDQQLVRWLRELRIDASTIELLARRENFDLHTLLHCVQSRDELTAAMASAPSGGLPQRATRRVPAGSVWRIWNAIVCHRRRQHTDAAVAVAASSQTSSNAVLPSAADSRQSDSCRGASEPRCPCALCSS